MGSGNKLKGNKSRKKDCLSRKFFAATVTIASLIILINPSLAIAAPALTITDLSASPNPFSPAEDGSILISATISNSGFWTRWYMLLNWRLTILDEQENSVAFFYGRRYVRGNTEVSIEQPWNGRDSQGEPVTSGRYYYIFRANIYWTYANPASGEITVTSDSPQTLGIAVSSNAWNIGEVNIGTTTTMNEAERLTVTNSGDCKEDFVLSLVNPSTWTAGSGPGAETFVLNAAFSQGLGDIAWNEGNHHVTTEPATATESRFAGGENGINISPSEARGLFLQFKSPTQTKVINPESITLIISCEVSKED